MVKLDIKIQNKVYYLLVLVLVVVLINGFVIAFTNDGSGDATKMGHSSDELNVDINNDGILDKSLQAAIDEGDLGGSLTGIHYVDNEAPYTYPISERFHMTLTGTNYGGKTKLIPHDILTDLCGDFDGCEVRLGMTKWTSNIYTETASGQHLKFYYSPTDGRWRSNYPIDYQGIDNDGVTTHVFSIWNTCYITDGTYNNYVDLGDNSVGFSLLVWTGSDGSYNNPQRTCELTLID